MLTVVLISILAILIIAISLFVFVAVLLATPPKGTAQEMLSHRLKKGGRIVACIGDSLTHGNLGVCWVSMLRKEFPEDAFLNEGINGELTSQVIQRIKPILECKPDIAILMIGSNDVMGSFDKASGQRYMLRNKLTELPTFENYKKMLPELIDHLSVVPRMAICTLPPIGEYHDSEINKYVSKFNDFITKMAQEKNVSLLNVSDLMWDELDKRAYPVSNNYNPEISLIARRMLGGCIQHYIFKKPWDKVGESKGQWLLFDQIHLGERGARVMYESIKRLINQA
jgi:lysophospholipase L1-like esterase